MISSSKEVQTWQSVKFVARMLLLAFRCPIPIDGRTEPGSRTFGASRRSWTAARSAFTPAPAACVPARLPVLSDRDNRRITGSSLAEILFSFSSKRFSPLFGRSYLSSTFSDRKNRYIFLKLQIPPDKSILRHCTVFRKEDDSGQKKDEPTATCGFVLFYAQALSAFPFHRDFFLLARTQTLNVCTVLVYENGSLQRSNYYTEYNVEQSRGACSWALMYVIIRIEDQGENREGRTGTDGRQGHNFTA